MLEFDNQYLEQIIKNDFYSYSKYVKITGVYIAPRCLNVDLLCKLETLL